MDIQYITSAYGMSGLVQKKATFADFQYCIYADIVGGWVGQKNAKVILT